MNNSLIEMNKFNPYLRATFIFFKSEIKIDFKIDFLLFNS